jgi:hypothetical protein
MNVLNQSTAAQLTEQSASGPHLNPATLIPKGSVFTVIGQVRDWQLGFAGRIRCTLRLSIGDLALSANRDTLPLHIGDGDWVRVKLMHRHSDGPAMQVISAVATAPVETSWVPVALYHRNAAMRELRRLLSTLEPSLQAVFMAVMLDLQVQRRFFWRPAAVDHHCYPGGLFDQSIAAGVFVTQALHASERDRGIAILASLLFDIGKATDQRLQEDRTRCWPELQPHATTATRLKGPLRRLAQSEPALAADLGDVLGADSPARITTRLVGLRDLVRHAARTSWGPDNSFLATTTTNPGAAA